MEVIADVFGGETIDSGEETRQPQQEEFASVSEKLMSTSEEPAPIPEEPESPEPQVTMAQIIQQLMAEYKPIDFYTAFTDIPEKKLRNALKSYGDDPKGELVPYVLALFDATITGNAKMGFCCSPAASCTGSPAPIRAASPWRIWSLSPPKGKTI